MDVEIRSARDLPNMDKWMSKIHARNDVTDAYVDVRLGNARIAKTRLFYHQFYHGTGASCYLIPIIFNNIIF